MNSMERAGRIAGLFANAINELEAEVDRADGVGVAADIIEDINADLSRLYSVVLHPAMGAEGKNVYIATLEETS